jgi:flagellar P-ring protein FlgI
MTHPRSAFGASASPGRPQRAGKAGSAVAAWLRPARPRRIHPERLLRLVVLLSLFLASAAVWWPVQAARIKEVAKVQGVRPNQLTGFGLVFGLDGTGDQSTQAPFTPQALAAFLQQNGITLPPGVTMQPRNLASVVVTAELPPFAQPGQRIDVNVSSAGNAKSLRGGLLLQTALRGTDGQIYAIAQGNLIVGGAGAAAGGAKVQINHLAAGRVPEGATVERSVPMAMSHNGLLQLDLQSHDFATARAVADAINAAKGPGTAQAVDGRVVQVRMPVQPNEHVAFMADLENLEVRLQRPAARVVINSRTGSVVMNESVTLSSCAVAHGALTVTVNATPLVSQPNALAGGQTVQAEKNDIAITQEGGQLMHLPSGAKLADVVRALNTLGASPQDLQAILQAMKSAGALNAEIEVI